MPRSGALRAALLNASLIVVSLIIGLVFIEAGLRLAVRRNNPDAELSLIMKTGEFKDPNLGFRIPPNAPGHDARGFRNPSALTSADFVALGDSQTWGYNARREDSWPAVLQKLSGRSAYNMAIPGSGPVQYWALSGEALQLSPRVVIVGFYFGNDLGDAYSIVYTTGAHPELRNPDIGSTLDRNTLNEEWTRFNADLDQFRRQTAPWRLGFTEWSMAHVAMARFLEHRNLWPRWDEQTEREYARVHPDIETAFDNGKVRTILKPALRLALLDQNEPRIREGLRLTEVVFQRLEQSCAEHNSRLLIALIPTKEMVFARQVQRCGALGPAYTRLIENEKRDKEQLERAFDNEGISYLDLAPPLQSALDANSPIYLTGGDGHPDAVGYKVIAEAVWRKIQASNW